MKKPGSFFVLFVVAAAKLLQRLPPGRILMPKMYMMDPMERMEQAKYLTGQPPSGNRIENMQGGLMNVVLGKEGPPIYIDQSPSYLYKDPKTEFNQNGVRMPMPDQNQLYRQNHPQILASNFYKPSDYDNTQTVMLPSIHDEDTPQPRRLDLQLNTIVSKDRQYIDTINPDGAVIQTNLAKWTPNDMQYEVEAAEQFRNLQGEHQRQLTVQQLLGDIQSELDDFKIKLGEKDDQVDSLLTRIYSLKIT